MVSLRCLSPLVLVLSLAARPGLAQKTDLTPLPLVQPLPRLPAASDQVVARRPVAPATAQQPTTAPAASVAKQPGPLVVLNSKLLAGLGGLREINPQDIEKIDIYKGRNYPGTTTPAQWRGLDENGIIDLTLKKKVRLKSQSLAQLARHLGAKGLVSYTINGLPAASGALRIVTESIEQIRLARTPTGTTVGVWFLQTASKPSPPRPPGIIMLRGTASR